MLWGRSANRCAFESCRKELVFDATETDDESLIGEECHIVGKKEDGPRGNSPLTSEQRDKYSNLVLLCSVHHKLVDDQTGKYTVEHLQQIKTSHEQWVRESLDVYDPVKQRDDEQYATLVDEFCKRVTLDHWQGWTSFLLSHGHPRISREIHEKLDDSRDWFLSRVWPSRYPEIQSSFNNFRLVLQDFLNVFAEHSQPWGDDTLETKKFYQIQEWNPERYNRLHSLFGYHVDLIQDLTLELTRAANYVCDNVRENFFPTFRLAEGVLLAMHGPSMDLSLTTLRCEYRGDERTDKPYPGLESFKHVRVDRDFSFGSEATGNEGSPTG